MIKLAQFFITKPFIYLPNLFINPNYFLPFSIES